MMGGLNEYMKSNLGTQPNVPDPPSRVKKGMILVVDDENVVRKMTVDYLERSGFKVMAAADGRQGMDLFQDHADEISCVLLDLTMPKMNGEACFEAMRKIKDNVKVILSSGYCAEEISERFAGKGLAGFIQKPYAVDALNDKIMEVLDQD
ncbi:MAG: response regulator [Planctomycetes bacterium]|nr:response regulator [Planctomycetota bacterium]